MSGRTLSRDEFECCVYELFDKQAQNKDPEAPHNRQNRRSGCRGIIHILDSYPSPPNPDPTLVMIVQGFMAVENLLPDYISNILQLVRDSAGRQFFLQLWGGEEALHSWALAKWLERSGVFETKQIIEAYRANTEYSWDPCNHPETPINPATGRSFFADPPYGNAYTTLQERHTSHGYRGLGAFALRVNQPALTKLCERLEAEEMGHHVFYRNISELFMGYCPEEYAAIFTAAHEEFAMPAKYVNREDQDTYAAWSEAAMREGVVPASPRYQRLFRRQEDRASQNQVLKNAQRGAARVRCWNQYVSGISQIFTQLKISIPPSLASAPRLPEPAVV